MTIDVDEGMLGGYVGKLLCVSLSEKKIFDQSLLDRFSLSVLRKFVGGFGLGLKILYDTAPRGIHPLDPENPLIFMTGPLCGLKPIPCGNNTAVVTLNADTGFTAGSSHSHGFWGPKLKAAGYDGMIVTGKADKPVYLWIHDNTAEIRDAAKQWGKDTHETEDLVKKDVGVLKASVAAIGPAGENMATGALIENDKHHSFSHSGVGAVMGSKKVKAVAVHGSASIPVSDEEKLREAGKKWRHNLFKSDVAKGLSNAGTPKGEYRYAKNMWLTTGKNFLEVNPRGWGDGMSKHKITPKPCFGCPIACSYEIEITSGPYKGYVATPAGGGENLEGAASISGVTESGAVFYLADLCDRMGFESSTLGCTIALAIESYEKGLLTKENTDGLNLRWGDSELVAKLIKMAANKEGKLGKLMAGGPKRAAESIGGQALNFAVHVKGTGINLHDWRAAWGIMLGQLVGGGAGWPAPAADAWAPEPDVGFASYQDGLDPKDKPEAVAKTWPKKYWDDCHGTCWFAAWGVPDVVRHSAEAVGGATGWGFTGKEALMVGRRVVNLERAFNVIRGLTPPDDYVVSERMVSEPPRGRGKGRSMAPYVKGMVMEVYRLMGWDEKTGRPWRDTLVEVGLEDIVNDVWP